MVKDLKKFGSYQEAEYHGRLSIRNHCFQADVELFPGVLLIQEGRLEESATFLFRAVISFIDKCHTDTLAEMFDWQF